MENKKYSRVNFCSFQIFRCRYSTIWECLDRGSGMRYCVKIFQNYNRNDPAIQSELDMMYKLTQEYEGHPAVVQLVEIISEPSKLHVVMEWISGGNMVSRLVQEGPLTEQEAQAMIRSLLQGVEYIHSKHVVHANLQPENILLADDLNVKIADFGSAVDLEINEPFGSRSTNAIYTAPEVILGQDPYDTSADMWTIGCVAYYMLTGESPFDEATKRRAMHRVLRAEYSFPSSRFQDVSRAAKQFISSLIHVDPSVRLTAEEALDHPWLRVQDEERQPNNSLFGRHGLLSGSNHSRGNQHKQRHSMDGSLLTQLSSHSTASPSYHRRHKSLSPCPMLPGSSGKKSKSHRRKSSLESLSKGFSKLFTCSEEHKETTAASTKKINVAPEFQSASTISGTDDSWEGGNGIPPLSNMSASSTRYAGHATKNSGHRRQSTK